MHGFSKPDEEFDPDKTMTGFEPAPEGEPETEEDEKAQQDRIGRQVLRGVDLRDKIAAEMREAIASGKPEEEVEQYREMLRLHQDAAVRRTEGLGESDDDIPLPKEMPKTEFHEVKHKVRFFEPEELEEGKRLHEEEQQALRKKKSPWDRLKFWKR